MLYCIPHWIYKNSALRQWTTEPVSGCVYCFQCNFCTQASNAINVNIIIKFKINVHLAKQQFLKPSKNSGCFLPLTHQTFHRRSNHTENQSQSYGWGLQWHFLCHRRGRIQDQCTVYILSQTTIPAVPPSLCKNRSGKCNVTFMGKHHVYLTLIFWLTFFTKQKLIYSL